VDPDDHLVVESELAAAEQHLHRLLPDVVVASARVLTGGEEHVVVRVIPTTGGALIVRWPATEVADWRTNTPGEAAAISLAAGAGVPVASVEAVDDEAMIYRYVVGTPGSEAAMTPAVAYDVGLAFGRLHRITGEGEGPVQPDGTGPGWPWHTYFNDVSAVAGRLAMHKASELNGVDPGIVGRAADLVLKNLPSPRSHFVHGDAAPGNVLFADGRIAAVIDFHNAWFGDPAIDLAWWWWSCPATAEAFEQGSATASRIASDGLRVWAYRVAFLVGMAGAFATTHPTRARRISDLLDHAVEQLTRRLL
jgi:prepilin-type processing-associated H-X9-DG protein